MTSAALIRDLKAAGWVLDRIRGSHHVFKHPVRRGHLVVPHPKKDPGIGLFTAIRKQAGLQEWACVMSDSSSRHREPPLGGVAIQGRRTAACCALPWIASSLRSSQ